ncbi:MAG: PA2779 family protein [Gammaproteobacteria bacterium]|nr:PA2779 family protein [Gammaproteobacteria bacterium]
MNLLRKRISTVVALMLASFLFASVVMPAAQAQMVGTDALLHAQQLQQERAAVAVALERADVRAALLDYGVEPAQVQARVDSLSADEVHSLAQSIQQLPAAGDDPFGILLFIFVLLLITDILGLTNVFPFVNHRHR